MNNLPNIDLRSDTLTRPSAQMRAIMAEAIVGDDVFGEDETVNRLQSETATMLGKEAGLFVPSGTMGNQLAIKAHTQPGDEVICEEGAHIRYYEAAGAAFNSLTQLHPLVGVLGEITAGQIETAIHGDDVHLAPTGLIALENTHNRAGGTVVPQATMVAVGELAKSRSIPFHLDGARLMNAAVATGISAADLAAPFDSVSLCFSKGLGAPIGSVLCGTKDFIKRAHRYRKILGGGMRQVGIIASAALFALRNNVPDLSIDHDRARALALAVAAKTSVSLDPANVHTNIVIFKIVPEFATAKEIEQRLAEQGLLAIAMGPQLLRLVTHRDVSDADIDRAVEILGKVLA